MSGRRDQSMLNDAAQVLAALKEIQPERRMDALAITCRVFCDTKGTLAVSGDQEGPSG